MQVFIFGCSFSENLKIEWSWPTMLEQNFNVSNFAESGNSNAHIYLSFLENIIKMKPGDVAIVSWGEILRFFTRNPKDKQMIMETYFKYFHNEILDKEHYKYYLENVERLAKQAGVKLIVLWANPSDYGPLSEKRFSYDYLDKNTAEYQRDFDIDIRPALIFYSLEEIKKKKLYYQERIKYLSEDPRPNHIESKQTHLEIYNKIVEYLE